MGVRWMQRQKLKPRAKREGRDEGKRETRERKILIRGLLVSGKGGCRRRSAWVGAGRATVNRDKKNTGLTISREGEVVSMEVQEGNLLGVSRNQE